MCVCASLSDSVSLVQKFACSPHPQAKEAAKQQATGGRAWGGGAMSLQRFQQLREEHGALDEASQATQQDVVKRSFSTFYLVTSVLQFLLLLAALVFYSSTFSDDTSGTILICISNQTMFSSIYSFATSADVFLLNDTFICVPEQNDTILYMVIGGLAMCLCLAGLFCHLYLPTDHPSLPRVDVAVVVLVYYLNVIGPFGMVFTSGGGQTYLLFSLHGARVSCCVCHLRGLALLARSLLLARVKFHELQICRHRC